MSSHELSVRTVTPMKVRIDTSEQALVAVFLPCFQEEQREQPPTTLSELIVDRYSDSFVELNEKRELIFSIDCMGGGHGEMPEIAHQLREALAPHLSRGGVVEVVDHDLSASNSETIAPFFWPAKHEEAECRHGLEIALVYAERNLKNVLQPEALKRILDEVRAKAH
ncbi:hypothetical protein LJR189_004645 [Acidovorax delafieldii]|jgi:hypothetical protein|uniref:hypothetical protein n=1 Tax=Acidovorax delafieldii TaxID=47920 RepID=UPI003ECC275C